MYNVIITERVRPSAIWAGQPDPCDIGIIPGMFCGYNVEVTKGNEIGWMSCTFVESITELNDEYHRWEREELDLIPTGRIAFRGYYERVWDYEEREWGYREVEINTSCIIGYVD